MIHEVTLDILEWHAAVQIGVLRIMLSAGSKLNHASTMKRSLSVRLDEDTTGAIAEMAVCKILGVFHLPSVNQFHRIPDCAFGIEVRGTRLENGCLIFRNNDSVDRTFVLCTVDGLKVRVIGCIVGRDAKRDEWRRNPGGHRESWFVPQSALVPWDLPKHAENP